MTSTNRIKRIEDKVDLIVSNWVTKGLADDLKKCDCDKCQQKLLNLTNKND
jgi:hypothetical protein